MLANILVREHVCRNIVKGAAHCRTYKHVGQHHGRKKRGKNVRERLQQNSKSWLTFWFANILVATSVLFAAMYVRFAAFTNMFV